MDCRAVLTVLCLLIAHAVCGTVRNTGALKDTIQEMREEIQMALGEFGQLPNTSCLSLNIEELVGPDQEPLTAHNLSSFGCYMLKMSKLAPALSMQLGKIKQSAHDMERLMSGHTAHQDCSLPTFDVAMRGYFYVKCLLQRLDQRFSKATF